MPSAAKAVGRPAPKGAGEDVGGARPERAAPTGSHAQGSAWARVAAGPSDGPGSGRPSAREGPKQGPSHASGAPTSSPGQAPRPAAPTISRTPQKRSISLQRKSRQERDAQAPGPPSARGPKAGFRPAVRAKGPRPPMKQQQRQVSPGPRLPGRQAPPRTAAARLFFYVNHRTSVRFWVQNRQKERKKA